MGALSIHEFIQEQAGPIVDEWVEFARQRLPPSHNFTDQELADHAKVLLLALAADIRQSQDAQAKHEKSQGGRPQNAPEVTAVAQAHATQRFEQGFSFDDLISEFRALRASVIRRWTLQLVHPRREDLDELIRFGESMDQALSESASLYARKVDDSRNLLLGVLGHDLRTPLGVVQLSAHYLLRVGPLAEAETKAVARIAAAAHRMSGMVKDILDFTQTAMGVTLPINLAAADLGVIVRDIVAEVSALHPDSQIELTCEADLQGRWDEARIGQMLANLLANAVQHGTPRAPVRVVVRGDKDRVCVDVTNAGAPIPAEMRQNLFSPMRQSPTAEADRLAGSSGLGLGLYITKEIALAHGGSVEVVSEDERTIFSVSLPRTPPLSADRRAAALGPLAPRRVRGRSDEP